MSIDDVRTLVAERQRYDDWLAALEAKRSDTPARVFDRVHGDYFARRTGVIEKLREHVGSLSALGDDLEGRIGALETQLASHEDERAEAMLRTAVGEYDGERWESVRQEVEASIAQLADKRAALVTEVDDVRTLLASARSEPPQMAVADEPIAPVELAQVEPETFNVPTAESVDVSGAETITTAVDAIEHPHREAEQVDPAHNAAADELFAELPAPPMMQGAALPIAALSVYVSPTQDDLDGTDFDDALALFSSTAQAPEIHPTPLHGRTVDMLDRLEDAEGIGERQSAVATTPDLGPAPVAQPSATEALADSERDRFDDLAFLRSVTDPATQNSPTRAGAAGGQQKTLRCTECGTMNFPTEWYCERCGGELAAF